MIEATIALAARAAAVSAFAETPPKQVGPLSTPPLLASIQQLHLHTVQRPSPPAFPQPSLPRSSPLARFSRCQVPLLKALATAYLQPEPILRWSIQPRSTSTRKRPQTAPLLWTDRRAPMRRLIAIILAGFVAESPALATAGSSEASEPILPVH